MKPISSKSQILPLIHGYNLSRFLDLSPPDTTIRHSNEEIEINPDYLPWYRQDQLLLGWLRSSLTEPMLAQVVSSTTCRSLWHTLEDYYTSTSRSRIHDLKRQIQTTTKGSSSCSDYLLRLRRIADELAFIESPISKDNLVTTTINGLGTNYNSIIVAFSTVRCHNPFSFFDLRGLLLSHEALLQTQVDSTPVAFYTDRNGGDNRTRYTNRSNNTSTEPAPTQLPSQPNSNSNSNQFNEEKPMCQICTKFGHNAKICYQQYNHDKDWKPNPRFNQNARAFTTQVHPSNQDSTNWIIDSSANQYVTNDINNLSSFFAYKEPDKLQIDNGLDLPISHIGSNSFNLSNISIQLKNMLHVPSFSTNLISLSQLFLDNSSIFLTFSFSFCCLKDLHTKTPPIKISNFNGLYTIKLKPSIFSSQALLSIRTTTRM